MSKNKPELPRRMRLQLQSMGWSQGLIFGMMAQVGAHHLFERDYQWMTMQVVLFGSLAVPAVIALPILFAARKEYPRDFNWEDLNPASDVTPEDISIKSLRRYLKVSFVLSSFVALLAVSQMVFAVIFDGVGVPETIFHFSMGSLLIAVAAWRVYVVRGYLRGLRKAAQ